MRKGDWISRLLVVNKNGRGTLTRISTIAKYGKRCWLVSNTALPRNSGLLDRHKMYGKKSWISHGCWVYLDLSSTSQNWFILMAQDGSRKVVRSGIFQWNSVTSRCADDTSDWITRRNQWCFTLWTYFLAESCRSTSANSEMNDLFWRVTRCFHRYCEPVSFRCRQSIVHYFCCRCCNF